MARYAQSPRARCLTGACSRQAESVPSSARAQRPLGTLRNVRLCGRGPEGLQLMRMSLGGATYDGRAEWMQFGERRDSSGG
jgi:hypothetical protein